MTEKIILVYGASTTWGAWDIEKGGWVHRLKRYVDVRNTDENCISIYNLGIDGENTNDLLERFEFETKQRTKKPWYDEIIIIFAVGGNDSMYIKSKDNPNISPEKFENNLKELIKQTRKFTEKIIFIGNIKINESKTMPWDENGESLDNENTQKYNQIIESICRQNNLFFIDIFGLLSNEDLEDGLHPNSQGHEKMFEKIKEELIKNYII